MRRNENRCGGADLFLFHLLWLRGRQSGGLVEGRQLFRQGKILFAGADLRGFRAAADRGGMACLLAGLEETGVRYEFTVVSLEGVFQLWAADRNFAENSGGKRELQDRRESK